jgi:hypothetical protein
MIVILFSVQEQPDGRLTTTLFGKNGPDEAHRLKEGRSSGASLPPPRPIAKSK